MTLLFVDGFDHYTTVTQAARKWNSGESVTFPSTGRNSGQCCQFAYTSTGQMTTLVAGGPDEIVLGFAYRPSALANAIRPILYVYNSIGNIQLYMTQQINGTLELKNAVNTVLATASDTLPLDVWSYLEFKFKFHDTLGVLEMRKNGVAIIDFSGDTRYSTYPMDINSIKINPQFLTAAIDDLYILDTTGTTNNDFLGDVVVATIMPDGDSTNDWTATGAGTTNADRVDEATPDDDTTYVESATVAAQERYDYAAVPVDVDTIFGVQVCPYVKKVDDGGTRTLRTTAYSVAAEAVGATVGLGSGYVYVPQIFEQDPDAVAAWTPATVNAAKFGFEIVA